MYLCCYRQYKYKTVTVNLLYHYWALSRHLPTDITVVLYAQYIIANHMVNKPPSVGATKWNNITKRTSGKAPITATSHSRHYSAIALLIIYFVGFNIWYSHTCCNVWHTHCVTSKDRNVNLHKTKTNLQLQLSLLCVWMAWMWPIKCSTHVAVLSWS
jgi:hypothetical protein